MLKKILLIVILLATFSASQLTAYIQSSSSPAYFFGKKELKGIETINYNNYSQNLTILGFPMVSSAMWFKDFPVLDLILDVYVFVAYNKNVNTFVTYLNFYRTLKSIEYKFGKSNFSAVFYYSSTMNNYYNSMIRDLSISYNKYYFGTDMYLGFNYYLN
ncbi:hypothetical protein [Brachyspira catarrhinii]|uniref:Uncharacterized protein n=1 Tax=Brachyspira catarrhinii TaxID=2528966 RepID=A0ABY2TUA7_9SPIR|nr:hypothetical protein [Brachyspira catarrhinii]TKZ36407.1 hypothetical protein EZH24_00275 [Brachyspira catarrhinii]